MVVAVADIRLLEPGLLPIALGAGAVVAVLAFVLARRHELRIRLAAAGLRVLMCGLIGLLLARPSANADMPPPPQVAETWVLNLPGAVPPGGQVFAEPPAAFLTRLRNALAVGEAPRRVVVAGSRREAAPVRDAVAALGLPCEVHTGSQDKAAPAAAIVLDVPLKLEYGEPLTGTLRGPAGVTLRLDGAPVAVDAGGGFTAGVPAPGRHELVAETTGEPAQRAGRVVHVGPKARLLVVGFGREQVGHLAALLPNFELDLQPGPLLPAMLEGAAVVVMAVP
ncbi:MAG: hypothetical protein IT463_12970, partial [Planctomycetes bacterium]|nr:hypothetical protein [Planctomycetota bacterium]